MAKKQLTLTSKLLLFLLASDEVFIPVLDPYSLIKGKNFKNPNTYRNIVYQLEKRGWIKMVDKNAQRFIKLTQKGQLEALLAKAILPQPTKWDGKWRLLVFDIPEDAKDKRSLLRFLLRKNNFYKLQASVYINPYPINREGIAYLKASKLINYIRIMKVEEIDDDKDLKKKFKLQ